MSAALVDDALGRVRGARQLLEQLLPHIESEDHHCLVRIVLQELDVAEELLVVHWLPRCGGAR
jgi:hypothetical protein